MKQRIGELLVQHGIITREQLHEALDLQKTKGKRLGEILIDLGYLTPKDLIWMLSEQADIPFVELRPEMFDRNLIKKFPEQVLYNNNILPLYETDKEIYIVTSDPANAQVGEALRNFTEKSIKASGGDPERIEQLLNQFFLAEHLDNSVIAKQQGIMHINSDNATIKFIDESGETIEKTGSIEIIFKEEGARNE